MRSSCPPIDDFVNANNLRIHYRRWLPPTPHPDLPPLVLVHSLASAAHIWNFVASILAEHGHTVTALDQRGHGESDKPDSGYDFATIVADDHSAIHALDIVCPILVGHSWGAMVVLESEWSAH